MSVAMYKCCGSLTDIGHATNCLKRSSETIPISGPVQQSNDSPPYLKMWCETCSFRRGQRLYESLHVYIAGSLDGFVMTDDDAKDGIFRATCTECHSIFIWHVATVSTDIVKTVVNYEAQLLKESSTAMIFIHHTLCSAPDICSQACPCQCHAPYPVPCDVGITAAEDKTPDQMLIDLTDGLNDAQYDARISAQIRESKRQDIMEKLSNGYKQDEGKLRYDLISWEAIAELVNVANIGANKYDDNNWMKGMRYGQVQAALHRHLTAWWLGEEIDPQDGQHHLSSVMWCAMALQYYALHPELYAQFDDRPATFIEKHFGENNDDDKEIHDSEDR